jgi:DeoR family fructose operon transcriptional repressor
MSQDRIREIYKVLEVKGSATVTELADSLGVSEVTIRRDLLKMEDNHMLSRFYGGAKLNENQVKEKSLSVRKLYDNDIKKSLARFAASLIHDGDIVYIDGGSTTAGIVDFIRAKNILVVTQAINVLESLMEKNIRCFTASGFLKKNTSMIISADTTEIIKNMKFSIAFLGGNSVHPIYGHSASEDMEATLKRAVLQRSQETYVVVDSSKFNILTVPKFADLDEAYVITDEKISDFDYGLIPKLYYRKNGSFVLETQNEMK